MKSTTGATVLGRMSVAMLVAILAAATAAPARAALGGDAASVEADRAAVKGQERASTASGYEVREIVGSGGTRVREYLSSDGKVFAVSWQGPFMPNLRRLLGTYYPLFVRSAASPHPGGHRHLVVEQPGLVVQSNGRMRAFFGRAWDPTLLPQNFSTDDIG